MDSDLIKHRKSNNQLIIYPDADVSEPGTESESESEVQNLTGNESTDEDEADIPLANYIEQQNLDQEDNMPIARLAPHLRTITFDWEKTDMQINNTNFGLNFPGPPDPKFSPIDYFHSFFPLELLADITTQSVLYANQNNKQNFTFSENELRQFLGVLMLMGLIHMPDFRMFWAEGSRFPAIADLFSRNRFLEILGFLHFNDNNSVIIDRDDPNYDRIYKIRPFIESIRACCRRIDLEERNSIDEQIIPFKGKNHLKQYLPKKPNKWGFKVFSRCGVSGLTYDFIFYEGKDPNLNFEIIPPGLRFQPAKFVWKLCENVPDHQNTKIYFDNYFNFIELQALLKDRGILSIGTLRSNRIRNCPLKSEYELKREGRGSFDFAYDPRNSLCIVKWFDRRAITLSSTFSTDKPLSVTKRWDRQTKQTIEIQCPNIVKEYNSSMGGVDLFDMLSALYRTDHRGKKWYRRIFLWGLNLACVNGWLLYKRHFYQYGAGNSKPMPLRDFIFEISLHLRIVNQLPPQIERKTRGRPRFSNPDDSVVTQNSDEEMEEIQSTTSKRKSKLHDPISKIRFDNIGHLPEIISDKHRCRLCQSQIRTKCMKCNVHLCLTQERNCYREYHTN